MVIHSHRRQDGHLYIKVLIRVESIEGLGPARFYCSCGAFYHGDHEKCPRCFAKPIPIVPPDPALDFSVEVMGHPNDAPKPEPEPRDET